MRFNLDEVVEALSIRAPTLLAVTRSPGGCVSIMDSFGRQEELAYGRIQGRQVSTTQPCHTGSTSKLYVAALLLILQNRGLLSLDEPAERHLPFPLENPFGGPDITLRHLLSHTSGLCLDTFDACWAVNSNHYEDALRSMRAHEYAGYRGRWAAPVGDRHIYSTFGIGLASVAAENVLQEPFGDAVHELILEPLGMSCTAWPNGRKYANLTSRMMPGTLALGKLRFASPQVRSNSHQSCGMITTVGDHLKFLRMLWMDGVASDGRQIIPAAAVKEMLAPQSKNVILGLELGYTGLAAQLTDIGEQSHHWGHSGGYPFEGWTESRVYPSLGFAIASHGKLWDATTHINPPGRTWAGIVCDWVARWAYTGTPPARPLLEESWSYAAGLILAERMVSLGIDPSPSSIVETMLDSVEVGDCAFPTGAPFDRSAFTAAIEEVRRTGGDPPKVRDLYGSASSPVGLEELEMLSLAWGGVRAANPLLIRALADESDVAEPYRLRNCTNPAADYR